MLVLTTDKDNLDKSLNQVHMKKEKKRGKTYRVWGRGGGGGDAVCVLCVNDGSIDCTQTKKVTLKTRRTLSTQPFFTDNNQKD